MRRSAASAVHRGGLVAAAVALGAAPAATAAGAAAESLRTWATGVSRDLGRPARRRSTRDGLADHATASNTSPTPPTRRTWLHPAATVLRGTDSPSSGIGSAPVAGRRRPAPRAASSRPPPTATGVVATNSAGDRRRPPRAFTTTANRAGLLPARQPRLGDGLAGRQERRRDPGLRRDLRRRRPAGRRRRRRGHLQLASSFGDARAPPPPASTSPAAAPAGWATENITPPRSPAAYGDDPDGVPYQLFSADLGAAARNGVTAARPRALPGRKRPAGSGAPPAIGTTTCATSATGAALSADLGPTPGPTFDLAFAGATPDLATSSSRPARRSPPTRPKSPGRGECDPAEPNLYDGPGRR